MTAAKLIFNEISTGAENDLKRATEIVKGMIKEYGMRKETLDKFGAVSEPVAREMAAGALQHSKANISIAINTARLAAAVPRTGGCTPPCSCPPAGPGALLL